MKNSQGFARTSILIISFITLLIAAGWMWYSSNSEKDQAVDENVTVATSTNENKIVDTKGWFPFYDIKNRIEFMRPAYIEEVGINQIDAAYGSYQHIYFVNFLDAEDPDALFSGSHYFSMNIWDNSSYLDIEKPKPEDIISSDDIVLNGNIPAKRYKIQSRMSSGNVEFDYDNFVQFIYHDKYYSIRSSVPKEVSLRYAEEGKNLFDGVLETLKFVDFDNVSNWSLYQNDKFGFSFKYPKYYDYTFIHEGFYYGWSWWNSGRDSASGKLRDMSNVKLLKYAYGEVDREITMDEYQKFATLAHTARFHVWNADEKERKAPFDMSIENNIKREKITPPKEGYTAAYEQIDIEVSKETLSLNGYEVIKRKAAFLTDRTTVWTFYRETGSGSDLFEVVRFSADETTEDVERYIESILSTFEFTN